MAIEPKEANETDAGAQSAYAKCLVAAVEEKSAGMLASLIGIGQGFPPEAVAPAMEACVNANSEKMLRMLLDWRAELMGAADSAGLLHRAVQASNGCAKLLIERGADLGALFNGRSPLMAAVLANNPTMVRLIAAKRPVESARVESERWGQATCAIAACRQGYPRCVEALAKAKVGLETRDAMGWTAAMHAAAGGSLECVACLGRLADAGADLDARTPANLSPLGCAAAAGCPEAVDFLLARGVEKDPKRFGDGVGPLGIALENAGRVLLGKTQECVMKLLDAGVPLPGKAKRNGRMVGLATWLAGHPEFEQLAKLARAEAEAEALGKVAKIQKGPLAKRAGSVGGRI